ncbi:MAG TPA: di-heme oxidoredictase family protein [Thermoanaerobaculia bacterium]|nr:di-heme oxidoredictase family protein [Thermoanaerobaculia bacterium]
MRRIVPLLLVLITMTVEGQRRRAASAPAPEPLDKAGGGPLANLPPAQLDEFRIGRAEFINKRTVSGGLGPVFNRASCVECHLSPAVGGGDLDGQVRFREVEPGGPVLQTRAIGPRDGSPYQFRPEAPPPESRISRHRPPPLFGLGLVEATDDATFIALAQAQAARNDGTAGRVALVHNPQTGTKTVGKFGWKARIATLLEFSGDAYLNELGVTSPDFPDEICPSGNCDELRFNPSPGLNDGGEDIRAVADFMRFLARSRPITADVLAGVAIFQRIGCAACHVPELQTGANPNPALDRVTYAPYSDFLLHDMGFLGDGLTQGDAGPREMRTPPLWGIGARQGHLHDSRGVNNFESTISFHDGQGKAASDRYKALTRTEQTRLLSFLRSL